MKKLALLYFLTAFFIFKPYQVNHHGMLYGGDDSQYLAIATSLTYFEFPSFKLEYVDDFKIPPPSRMGGGLMIAPLVGLFSIFDRIASSPLIEKRTREHLIGSWTLFGAFFSTSLYFWLALVFLFKGLRFNYSENIAIVSIFAMVVAQGCALYAFRRPLMAHVAYLFLLSIYFFYLMKNKYEKKLAVRPNALPKTSLIVLLTCGVFLLREEGLLIATAWCVAVYFPDLKKICWTLTLAFLLFWITKNAMKFGNEVHFEEVTKQFDPTEDLIKIYPMWLYFKRTVTVLFGLDWGLVFTAPALLLGLLGIKRFSKSRYEEAFNPRVFYLLVLSLVPMFYLVVVWQGQGGWYGYRYLVFPAVPVLIGPFADLLSRYKKIGPYLLVIFLLPMASMLVFEHTPATGLSIVQTEFGERNWGNLTYQLEVWRLALRPGELMYAILKTGPAYIIYLLGSIFRVQLPAKFVELYGPFEWGLFIKTLLIYSVPLVTFRKSIIEFVRIRFVTFQRKVLS